MNDEDKYCFAPVFSRDAAVLILGSLPGEMSLARQEYYAHPQNQFWRLMGAVIARPLADRLYPDRLKELQQARVALWDVIARARRSGSLDQQMRDIHPNALGDLIADLPQLRLVAFNGQKAAIIGRKFVPPGIDHVILPSTSPAHTLAFEAKLERWLALRPFIHFSR